MHVFPLNFNTGIQEERPTSTKSGELLPQIKEETPTSIGGEHISTLLGSKHSLRDIVYLK